MPIPILTQETLRSILHYEPGTGMFTWIARPGEKAWNARHAGKPAGYVWRASPRLSYRCIRVFDWPFLAHRIAWLYMVGEWPENVIDHIDCDGLNNSFRNLRAATFAQNLANMRRPITNSTGFKGVSPAHGGKFRATIRIGGKQKWIGVFDKPEEAHAAYVAASKMRYGEFERAS